MKTDPIGIILEDNFQLDKKVYFISGNETTLMEKISQSILEKYRKNKNIEIYKIDSIENFLDETSLFENQKIYLGRSCKGINENNLNKIIKSNAVFIFIEQNSQKLKIVKKFLINNKNAYVIDCYELDKNSKIKILNKHLETRKMKMPQDIFWFLVDKLDNRYAFLEAGLKKIFELDKNEINIENVTKLLSINESGVEKIFFSLLKKNSEIVNIYREKIISNTEVNEFYYYCKYLCQIIIDCNNQEEYLKKIPKYLFKEKTFLISVYKKFNLKKKRQLLNLMVSTEKSLRQESRLSLISGLRFFLSIKKITVS